MIDISVQKVEKAFVEGVNILDGVSFEINDGERVGLLGANGAGKTTLFRLIVGELEPDEGDIAMPASRKLGLISQIPIFPEHYTAEDVLKEAFRRLYRVRERMEQLEAAMAQSAATQEQLAEYDGLAADFERNGGYTMDVERNRVANGLEIPAAQREQLFSTLSGGEKTRVNLARLILEDTDILLLDEPTNHLDMRATEWLEAYLGKFRGTVLVISHDRYFLDRVVTRSIEISDGKAELYGGNYSFYIEERQRRFDEKLTRYEREQAEIKRLKATADRFHGFGTERAVQTAKSIYSRIDRIDRTDRPKSDRGMKARFGEREFKGDEALVIKGLTKAFESKTLFSDVSLDVVGGERIALVGDNGSGKTTLLRILLGDETADAGMVKRGAAVRVAYLPQIVKFDNLYRSALDTLVFETKCSPQTARNRLGAFKFSGTDVFKSVGDLSGGEKSRLRLCILMDSEINFLILDEPTNHLDIGSREWIEEAVAEFEGNLLFVSHDRYFVEKFATRIWELDNGVFTDYRCGYSEYRTIKAASASQSDVKATLKTQKTIDPHAQDKPKKPSPKNVQRQIEKLEREIAQLEEQIADNAAAQYLNASDYERLLELGDEETRLNAELEAKMDEWAELSE